MEKNKIPFHIAIALGVVMRALVASRPQLKVVVLAQHDGLAVDKVLAKPTNRELVLVVSAILIIRSLFSSVTYRSGEVEVTSSKNMYVGVQNLVEATGPKVTP